MCALRAGRQITKWINEFGYVTIPVLSITAFMLILAFLLLAAFDHGEPAPPRRAGRDPATAVGFGISLLAILAVAIAAATSSSVTNGSSATPAAPAPAAGTTPSSQGNAALGKSVFEANGCSACHTLAAAGASGKVARPNLGLLNLSYATIVATVADGKTTSYGAAMSPFKSTLSKAEIDNVAAFVYQAEHSRG